MCSISYLILSYLQYLYKKIARYPPSKTLQVGARAWLASAAWPSSVHPQMFASKHKLKQTKERVARLRREGQQDIYTDEELEREGLLTEQLLPRNRTLQPSTLPSGSWLLGACDAEFVKGRPTFVDLLVFCEEPLDPGRLVAALQAPFLPRSCRNHCHRLWWSAHALRQPTSPACR
jgi:hypothetical protein